MNRTRRTLLWVGGGIIAVLVIAIGALVLFFPAERIGRMAAERASTALEREVVLERIRLGIFPRPAVILEGVVIGPRTTPAGPAGSTSSGEDLARIPRVEARPRLLALLGGQIQIHSFVVERPEITVDATDLASAPDADTDVADGPGFFDDATFQVRDIRISDGILAYRDTATGTMVQAAGYNQNLNLEGEMAGGTLARMLLRGGLSIDSLDVEMLEQLAVPIQGLAVSIEHDATLDLETETATLDRLGLRLEQLELEGSGVLRSWADDSARSVSLELASASDDVGALIGSLPASMRTIAFGAAGEREIRGTGGGARIQATVEGPIGPGVVPDVDGTLELTSIAVAAGADAIIEDLSGRITFSMDSVVAPAIAGRLLGEPVRIAAVVNDLSAPAIRGAVSGALNLGSATSLGLLPEGTAAGGRLVLDMSAVGPLEEPADLRLDGTLNLDGINITTDSLPAPVDVSSGLIELRGQEIVARGVRATLGQSDVTVDAAATGLIPFALGDSTVRPEVLLDARSSFVDAGVLFPTDPETPTYAELFFARLTGRPVDGMSAAEAAETAGLRLPELPSMVLDGRYQADRIAQRDLTFEQVDVAFGGVDGQLELREATFGLMCGMFELAAALGAPTIRADGSRSAPVRLSFELGGMEADAFLERFTPLRQHLTGALEMAGAMNMQLDEYLLPEPSSLAASGSISFLDGQLAGWPLLRAFGEQLGIATFDTINVRDWTGRFQMLGSRFVLEETSVQAERLDLSLGGWFDVSGQLDLAATAYLEPSLAALARGAVATRLAGLVTDSDGRIPIGVRVTGTTTQPSVSLDLSSTGAQVAERVREEAEQRAQELARELAEEAAERLTGGDSLGVPLTREAVADTVRGRVREAVGGRLRGLLGGRNEPEAAPAPASAPADTAVSIPPPPEPPATDSSAAEPPS